MGLDMEPNNAVTVDEALTGSIGEFGRGQRWMYTVVCTAWVGSGLLTMVMVFSGRDAVQARMWRCVDPKDAACATALAAPSPDVCGLPRSSWEWTAPRQSIVSDWDLICRDAWKAQATNSGFFLGFLIGAALFGFLADRCGRRPTLFAAVCSAALLGAASASAPDYWWYLACRSLTGVGVGGIGLVSFVLATEFVGPNYRGATGIGTMYFSVLGSLLIPPLAWLLPAWRTLTLVASVPCLLYLAAWSAVQESPRWLLISGRKGDATAVLAAIAVANRTRLPEGPLADVNGGVAPRKGMAELLGAHRLRLRLAVTVFAWFTVSLSYYGSQLAMGSLSGSIYINTALSFLIELPAFVVCGLLIDRIGRRPLFVWSLLLGGAACIACAATAGSLQRFFAMAGRFGTSAAFTVSYIYTAELFPTVVRSTAMGCTSVSARLGGIVAPIVVLLGQSGGIQFVSFLAFGTTMTLAGILAAALPETLGVATAETLSQPLLRGSPDDARMDIGHVHPRRGGWAALRHSLRSLMRPSHATPA